MIPVAGYENKTVAVFGLGRAGIAAAHALDLGGADVWAWDDNEQSRTKAEAEGVTLTDLYMCDWEKPSALVLSPGVPFTHPAPHAVAERALAHSRPVVGEVELLNATVPEARYIGITGTNGKSTTTSLIGHIFEAAGRSVQIGGNLGVPALELEKLDDDGTYVLEMSSYQLDLTHNVVFDVALLLNITPDHLDRHGGMDGYVRAKKRIFAGQAGGAVAIVGVDDDISQGVFEGLSESAANVVPISTNRAIAGGVYVLDGVLIDAQDAPQEVLDLSDIQTLAGKHNWQNAAAAFSACRASGIERKLIVNALKDFPGLAHRQERVGEMDGVVFINDSKATNVDAAVRALSSYQNIYWIAGGQAKDTGLQGVEPYLESVRHAYLIGNAEDAFEDALTGKVPTTKCATLDKAVAFAVRDARANGGGVILLSPACASFDQFANFEARGNAFKKAVGEVTS